jgi:hypothetical protein
VSQSRHAGATDSSVPNSGEVVYIAKYLT